MANIDDARFLDPIKKQDRIDRIADFFANPFQEAKLKDLQQALGVSEATLWRFRQENKELIDEITERKRKNYHTNLRSAAYKALANRLERSDKAIETALKLLGDLVERTESRVEYMTPDQKRAKLAALLSEATAKGLLANKQPDASKSNDVAPGSTIISKPTTDA